MSGHHRLVPTWKREHPAAVGRDAHVLFVCFATGQLRDNVKLQVNRFGISCVESFHAVETREHLRESNREWFDNWRSGPVRNIATQDLRGDLAALDAADRCFTFEVTVADPPDLAHLQSIWALTRWFSARGATTVLDAHAMRWLGPHEVADPSEPFDAKREISLIFETDPTEPNGGHVLHTRGLRKFGRPDIVAVCSPDDVELIAEVIWQLASGMALGFMPALPQHGVDISETVSWYLVADSGDAFAKRLGLNNDARVLVDENGDPLIRAAMV